MIDKKVVLVTGGTRGIGLAIAEKFVKAGYFAVVCARHPPKITLFGGDTSVGRFFPCDISSSADRQNLLTTILDKLGRLDILVNNAGMAPPERRDILDATESSFEKVLKVNLQGPYFLTQAIANHMISVLKSSSLAEYMPCIVNISSISAFTSSPARGEYCISKAGFSMMTSLYADRLSEFGIPVFEIQPGIIKTEMTAGVTAKYDGLIEKGLLPFPRWGQPGDIAEATLALASGKLPYCTGQVLHIDGGFHLRRLQ